MTSTAADILIDTIEEWGLDVIFGMPGDGIHGIMEALRKWQKRIRFLQVRHEEAGRVYGLRVCSMSSQRTGL